jgi:hypothetical protein
MPEKPSDLIQGTLDMLILKTLALEPMHGYGISVRIEQISKGVFCLNAGSLFLAIQRSGVLIFSGRTRQMSRRYSMVARTSCSGVDERQLFLTRSISRS